MIGLIGVGAMGLAMTEKLIAAGHALCGSPRSQRDAFIAAGGTALAGNAAVALAAEMVLLLVADDAALDAVMNDIVPVLKPGRLIVCLGTHPVAVKEHAAARASAAGAIFVEGEISGTPAMLRAGRASVMLAGDEVAASRAGAPLADVASSVSYVGAFGNALRMKLIANYLVGVHTLAAAEALVFAERLGLDPKAVVDTISASAGGSAMFTIRGRMMAEKRFGDGTMTSFVKFFELLEQALEVPNGGGGPLLELTDSLYRTAIAEGHGGRDIAAIYDSLRSATPAVRAEADRVS